MRDMSVPPGQVESTTTTTRPSEQAYIFAAGEAENARLIAFARRSGTTVREMCARAGVGAGARVADIGCGPVGALLDLAAVVGPQGAVMGLDSSAGAIATARAIVAEQHLGNVRVVHGDINTLDPAALTADGPFDAAHLRLVLVHQADPAATLRQVAALLRPGGRVLAADFFAPPRFDPPVPAHERAWALMFAVSAARGAAQNVAYRLPRLCEEAGLRVLDVRGSFGMMTPARELLEAIRTTFLTARPAIVGTGMATTAEVDAVADGLAAAEAQDYRSAIDALFVEVIAEVPQGG